MPRTRVIVLGTLLSAMAAVGLHPALADQQVTATHWELHGFADVDGERKVDKKLIDKPFQTAEACVAFALKLDPPPPAKQIQGHTIIYGYTCQKVEEPAMETMR